MRRRLLALVFAVVALLTASAQGAQASKFVPLDCGKNSMFATFGDNSTTTVHFCKNS